jgi:hypothetical protein
MKPGESRLVHVCAPRFLPKDRLVQADEIAFRLRPDNRPPGAHLGPAGGGEGERLVVDRRVYWGKEGVKLTVGFLDNPSKALRERILAHMNAWNARGANIEFVESSVDPQVRIARSDDPPDMAGYWSYLGTDILTIDPSEPTMNLEGFTMRTPDAEFHRVVRHETGHTLGFPHEHLRKTLVDKLDREKTIAYFKRTQGWTKREVEDQVLTPLESRSIRGSARSDAHSIMCYDAPGEITKDGEPIAGGTDIDDLDYEIVELLYPAK